jgi:hypothetical protein
MKMKNVIYVTMGFMLSLAACKKEQIQLNIPEATIYMSGKSLRMEENFANYPESTTDVFVDLIIKVTGAPQNYDRAYQWVAQDSSTAVQGRDYEFVVPQLVVKAGKLIDTVKLKLKRNASLGEAKTMLYLKLVPGKDFRAKIDGYEILSTISMYNAVDEPLYWYGDAYNYFGEYSKKKFLLLQDIAGMPAEILNRELTEEEYLVMPSKLKRWGLLLKRYLEEMHAKKETIWEDEAKTIRMVVGEYLS